MSKSKKKNPGKNKKVDEAAFNSNFKSSLYNPWGPNSTKNPTNSSQTTGP